MINLELLNTLLVNFLHFFSVKFHLKILNQLIIFQLVTSNPRVKFLKISGLDAKTKEILDSKEIFLI